MRNFITFFAHLLGLFMPAKGAYQNGTGTSANGISVATPGSSTAASLPVREPADGDHSVKISVDAGKCGRTKVGSNDTVQEGKEKKEKEKQKMVSTMQLVSRLLCGAQTFTMVRGLAVHTHCFQ
jgi:hypothetical protein